MVFFFIIRILEFDWNSNFHFTEYIFFLHLSFGCHCLSKSLLLTCLRITFYIPIFQDSVWFIDIFCHLFLNQWKTTRSRVIKRLPISSDSSCCYGVDLCYLWHALDIHVEKKRNVLPSEKKVILSLMLMLCTVVY